MPAYVRSNGYLSRDPPLFPRFSKHRLALVLAILTVLFITNPANRAIASYLPESAWQKASYRPNNQQWKQKYWLQNEVYTNYGIFVLGKAPTAVSITGLLRTAHLCNTDSHDPLASAFCNTIVDKLCHGKPFLGDWNKDLAYTTCQFVSLLIVSCMLLSFCAWGRSPLQIPKLAWLDQALSVLDGLTFFDLVRWNWLGYPALKAMERLIAIHVYNKERIHVNFVIACITLLFGVGGFSNYLGSRFQDRRVVGIDGMLAACMGYHAALGNQILLFRFLGVVDLTLTNYFWLDVVHLLLTNRLGAFAAVLTGASLGHAFATFHQQWLLERLMEDLDYNLRRLWWRISGRYPEYY